MYDLEPLNVPVRRREELPQFSFNPLMCDSPGYCVMKTLKFHASGIDPAICGPGHEDALKLISLGFRPVPGLVKAGKPAVFVHPKLQLHGSCNHFAPFVEAGKDGVNYESFERLLRIDIETVPVAEALTALQALLVYLATFLFSSVQAEQENAESLLNVLSEWTQTLLASAQARTPPNQSPWQEWLLGESLRRTIIMSYALSLSLYSFKYGYCSNWLFVESLPFDKRAGLWMAESPQAWIAAARARTGDEVGEQLNSFHEFAGNRIGSDPHFGGDTFLALCISAHNGGSGNHELRPGGN